MTIMRCDPKFLETWLKQNEAECTGDFVEGVLLDSFMVWTKRGVAAVYEHFLNAWSSDYMIDFEPGDGKKVWENWYTFADGADGVA